MKTFKCGLCKENQRVSMNRFDLRKHLKEEHRIRKNITNKSHDKKIMILKNKIGG